MRILVDAMGGDNGPEAIVNGCIDAIRAKEGFDITLIGDDSQIFKVLKKRKFSNSRIEVIHAQEVITNDDLPAMAIRRKKKSSMVVGFNLLKENKGDAFVSAGSTGALLSGSLFILGRLKGVDRPALGVTIPTKKGRTLLIDAGLNTACKPINYYQFGIFGSTYMKEMYNIKEPKVGLINMGTEAKKGTAVLKSAYELLSKSKLNFVGNIEGKDVPVGSVDVAVCDGFIGNVLLKFFEGAGSFFFSFIKNMFKRSIFSKFSLLLVMKDMKDFKKKVDPEEYGGAPILGVNGLVIKTHGNSIDKTIKNVVIKAYTLSKSQIFDNIKKGLENLEVKEIVES